MRTHPRLPEQPVAPSDRAPNRQTDGRPGADLAALGALALALRVVGLNAQLWSDEIAAVVNSFRKSFGAILTQPATFVSHPLYELMARGSILAFGEHPWAARLPAALFGAASVPLLYLVVRRLGTRAEALLAGGLLAVSYHHVFFSQNARGYTVMIFFFLAATLALLGLRDGLPVRARAGYVAATVLAAFAIPFGVAVAAGQAAVALAAVWWWRRRGHGLAPRAVVLLVGAAGALIVLAYLPLLGHTLRFATTAGGGSETGSALSPSALRETIEGLRAGLGGWPGLAVAAAVGAAGLAGYRRRAFALGLLVAPVAVTLVTLQALGVVVHPRYLMIAAPGAIAIAARGLVLIGERGARLLWGRERRRVPAAAGAAALALVLLAGAAPLPRYYRTPKMDLLGALRFAEDSAGPGDRVVATSLAGHVLAYYRPGFPTVESLDDLLAAEASAQRLWVISTLDGIWSHHDPGLLERLQTRYRLARLLPSTVEDGQMRIYEGSGA